MSPGEVSDEEDETPSQRDLDDDESSDIFVSELLESNGFEVNMDSNAPGRDRFK